MKLRYLFSVHLHLSTLWTEKLQTGCHLILMSLLDLFSNITVLSQLTHEQGFAHQVSGETVWCV